MLGNFEQLNINCKSDQVNSEELLLERLKETIHTFMLRRGLQYSHKTTMHWKIDDHHGSCYNVIINIDQSAGDNLTIG